MWVFLFISFYSLYLSKQITNPVKTFLVNNDLIDEIEVSAGKSNICIYATVDGTIVEKNKLYTKAVNLYHLEHYINELTESNKQTKEIMVYIKSKIWTD